MLGEYRDPCARIIASRCITSGIIPAALNGGNNVTHEKSTHRSAHKTKTWLTRLGFTVAVSALAFGAATHFTPTEASAQTRSGESRAEEADYLLTLSTSGAYTAGKQGNVVLKLTPKTPFKVNSNFPIKFVLADPPSENVAYTKKKLEKADGTITDGSFIFNVPFTSAKAGKATVAGKLHFQVVDGNKTNTHNIDMSLTVDVGAATP